LAGDGFGGGYFVGDFTSDGIDDLLIGAVFASNNARALSGSLYMLRGRTNWPTAVIDMASLPAPYDVRYDGANPFDLAGFSPVVRDFDGDGRGDLAFAAFFASNNAKPQSGSLYIIYGTPTAPSGVLDLAIATSYHVRIDGEASGDQLGFFSFATDIDGDGFAELAVGASGRDVGALADAGVNYLIYGGYRIASGNYDLASSPIFQARVLGAEASGLFTSASFARINRDGTFDIIASATNTGSAYLIAGWNNRYSGTLDLSLAGTFQHRYDASHPTNQITGAHVFRFSTDFLGSGKDDLTFVERRGDGPVWDSGSVVFIPTPP
jgi:hypothetical protein